MGNVRGKYISTDKNGRETIVTINKALADKELAKPREKRSQGYQNLKLMEIIMDEPLPEPEPIFTEQDIEEKAMALAQEMFNKMVAEQKQEESPKSEKKPKEKINE